MASHGEASANENSDLNSMITNAEIEQAINKLKYGKSAGPDMVEGEMLKYASGILIPYFSKLFNAIYDKSVFPTSWARSFIVPLHKKGSTNDPNNYRGISLTSIVSKVFTSILNRRLQYWANVHESIPEEQGGFRKGYSTIDSIFTLHTMIHHYLTRKKSYLLLSLTLGKHSTR